MTQRYKVEGYAETRDALAWVMLSAPNFKYGLTLEEIFCGLEHGFQSVRYQLKDVERVAQWQASHQKLGEALEFYKKGDVGNGTRTTQEASELFIMLRRLGGSKVSRQELGSTEHGANELDE
ncbi:MAG: hypothetical protein V4505_13410 [Pseudomonadota bacterium]